MTGWKCRRLFAGKYFCSTRKVLLALGELSPSLLLRKGLVILVFAR